LVHCLAGVSRSVCVVAAYLIVTCELTYAAAMSYITSKRPCANPNFGFRMQLAEYQKKGCTERLVISNHFDSQKMDELKQNDMRILLDYPATMLPSADLSNSSSDNSHDGFTTYARSCTSVRGSQNNNTARTLLNTSDISFIDQ
uniref:Dual specificity protein phosphatase 22 n=1 Tax=Gongylonema pulchrum TaxID=637853 RepID=A0A183D962_9BILA